MKRAANLLRVGDHYRREAFSAGLRRLGYTITDKPERSPRPGDLLLLWNRSRAYEPLAQSYERTGATVVITENGYSGRIPTGGKLYALALGKHNGAGSWPVGAEQRRPYDVRPWRTSGDHILVLPQRGVGSPGVAMPPNWTAQVVDRLKRVTKRPIRVRKHPGAKKLEPWGDLDGAHAVVTWGSGAAVKSILYGVPVFHELRQWIGADAARYGISDLEDCPTVDRTLMLLRLSYAEWALNEIESGEAFAWLLGVELV